MGSKSWNVEASRPAPADLRTDFCINKYKIRYLTAELPEVFVWIYTTKGWHPMWSQDYSRERDPKIREAISKHYVEPLESSGLTVIFFPLGAGFITAPTLIVGS
jgi:hypothetical protein